MSSKVDDVLALVSAASAAEPTMQQLLLQVQQAQLHADADAAAIGLAQPDAALDLIAAVDAVPASDAVSVAVSVAPPEPSSASSGSAVAVSASVSAVSVSAPPGVGVGATGATSAQTIRRKSIPLSMKKQAIEWILGPGKGVPSRAEKHFSALNWDVSASSFRKWWKNRDKIMNDSSTKKRISGGGRKPYLEEGEERLLVIVIQERAKKDRVTRKWIAKTAQHMFQRTNANFKASENWVTKFIRRNGLTLKRSYVTYDHGDAAPPSLTNGSAAQALGIAPGSIQVHEDDDDDLDDDDEPETEQTGESDAPHATDAYVV